MSKNNYTFDGEEELFEVAKKLPKAKRHEIYARNVEKDDWKKVFWRNSLWLEDSRFVDDIFFIFVFRVFKFVYKNNLGFYRFKNDKMLLYFSYIYIFLVLELLKSLI